MKFVALLIAIVLLGGQFSISSKTYNSTIENFANGIVKAESRMDSIQIYIKTANKIADSLPGIASEYFDIAYKLSYTPDDYKTIRKTAFIVAKHFETKKDIRANRFYTNFIKLSEACNQKDSLYYLACINLSLLLDGKQSWTYLNKSITTPYKKLAYYTYLNLASYYIERDSFDLAFMYANLAKYKASQSNIDFSETFLLYANIYIHQGNNTKASEILNTLYQNGRYDNSKDVLLNYYYYKGTISFNNRNLILAEECYKKAFALADNNYDKLDIIESIVDLFTKKNNYKEALKYELMANAIIVNKNKTYDKYNHQLILKEADWKMDVNSKINNLTLANGNLKRLNYMLLLFVLISISAVTIYILINRYQKANQAKIEAQTQSNMKDNVIVSLKNNNTMLYKSINN